MTRQTGMQWRRWPDHVQKTAGVIANDSDFPRRAQEGASRMEQGGIGDTLAIRFFALPVEPATVKTKEHSHQRWQRAVQNPSV